MSIYDAAGTKVAEYLYDAWGKCTIRSDSTGIGAFNPIRYRGYYYDTETGLYYLNSRYYDPNTGRFINADVYVATGQGILGNNMFAYCNNNPVSFEDPNGQKMVSIREFVESRGGSASWNSLLGIAMFSLNGKNITTGRLGDNNIGLSISNNSGTMIAEDYELAYYFKIKGWATYYPGFRWYDGSAGDEAKEGFQVETISSFFNKTFCWEYAGSILDVKGVNGKYLGCNQLDIAMECYGHAVGKIVSTVSTSIHYGLGDSIYGSAKAIGFIGKEKNYSFYRFAWWSDIIIPTVIPFLVT